MALRLVADPAAPMVDMAPVMGALNRLGEPLYGRATPDGYPLDEGAWNGSGQMAARFEVARTLSRRPAGPGRGALVPDETLMRPLSERTRSVVDMQQRFPMPFREQVLARTQAIGLDVAYVYGLIRQESRFIIDARSGVGASGLMQVMPATARWTARKIGLDYSHELITDRDVNLTLGTGYLKLVLDDFAGSQPLAAAAYNAGPSRSRRWREGPLLDPAAWAENIPFSETRDYVKKVLSNAAYYAALLGNESVSLSARLGESIGPRDPAIASADRDLP